MIPELDRVVDPAYLARVAEAPIEQIRAMRAECTDLENGASYVRRLAQGRLDLLAEETISEAENKLILASLISEVCCYGSICA